MTILNFHGLGSPKALRASSESDYWIPRSLFVEILDAIRARPDVRITFDDGNESDYTIALPLLREAKVAAHFFLVAGWIGQPGYLSTGQIRSLHREGMAIGSHGMHHRRWSSLPCAELDAELLLARERLEDIIEASITEVACPFGAYSRRVLRKLGQIGFRRVYTSDGGSAVEGAAFQPRHTVVRTDTLKGVLEIIKENQSAHRVCWDRLRVGLKRLL